MFRTDPRWNRIVNLHRQRSRLPNEAKCMPTCARRITASVDRIRFPEAWTSLAQRILVTTRGVVHRQPHVVKFQKKVMPFYFRLWPSFFLLGQGAWTGNADLTFDGPQSEIARSQPNFDQLWYFSTK